MGEWEFIDKTNTNKNNNNYNWNSYEEFCMVLGQASGANIELIATVEKNVDQCRRFNNIGTVTTIFLRYDIGTLVGGIAAVYSDKVYLESRRTSECVYLYGRNSL